MIVAAAALAQSATNSGPWKPAGFRFLDAKGMEDEARNYVKDCPDPPKHKGLTNRTWKAFETYVVNRGNVIPREFKKPCQVRETVAKIIGRSYPAPTGDAHTHNQTAMRNKASFDSRVEKE